MEKSPDLAPGFVRLAATTPDRPMANPRPCAGDCSVGVQHRTGRWRQSPALRRGLFGWLLQHRTGRSRESPGLAPGKPVGPRKGKVMALRYLFGPVTAE